MKKENLKIAKFVLNRNQARKIRGGETNGGGIGNTPGGSLMPNPVITGPVYLDCSCDCSCHKTVNDGCIDGSGTKTSKG